jgi:hypothetical protein
LLVVPSFSLSLKDLHSKRRLTAVSGDANHGPIRTSVETGTAAVFSVPIAQDVPRIRIYREVNILAVEIRLYLCGCVRAGERCRNDGWFAILKLLGECGRSNADCNADYERERSRECEVHMLPLLVKRMAHPRALLGNEYSMFGFALGHALYLPSLTPQARAVVSSLIRRVLTREEWQVRDQ